MDDQRLRMSDQRKSDQHGDETPTLPVSDIGNTEQPHTPFDTFGEEFHSFWIALHDWRTRIDLAGVIVVTIYTALTFALWRTTSDALKESRAQTKIQADGLRLTHRPWLEPHISIAKPLTFHDTYAEVVLSITMRNGGTGPATSAEPRIGLTITGESGRPLQKGEDVFCTAQAVKAGGGGAANLILPNSEITFPNYGLQTNPPWILSKDGTVYAVVTGCIGYLDETGEPHATFVRLMLMGDFKPTGTIEKPWILLPVIDPPY